MKKKLLFITFLMLFCSTMFGQFTPKYSYTSDGTYDNPMTLSAVIEFDGEEQINPNLELGVFCGDELRGGAFVIERKGRYYARPLIYGQSGQFFTFKVYDHTTGIEREWSVGSTFTYGGSTMEYMSYNSNGYGNFSQPAVIDFVTPNYWNPEPFQFNFQVTAVILKDGVEQTDTNLELGAFSVSDGTVRGSVKLYPQTILGNTRYYAYMLVGGTSGEEITFKLYDHGTRQELQFNDVNTCILTEDDDATGNPILGSYIKPFEVNFITASYVAQIGNNKYLSFDAALEAAEDGDEITLLEDVTLAVNPTVVSKDININLDGNTVTGTIVLANTGATVTGVAEAMTVTSGVEGYIVVCENNVYSLSERQPSGKVAYRAYINDSESREAVQVDLTNVYAKTSFVVELLDANDNVLTTTSLKAGKVNAESYTCNIVLEGTASGSWDTEIKASKLTVANIPATINVYADGTLVDTYANALGAGTNVDETEKYKALDCVYKEAKIGETLYATFAAAYEKAATGNEIILLANVDFAETTVSKDININLNNNTVTGTIILANTDATVTCTEGAVNVTTSLAGYEVVYESGVYKLVRRQASAEVAYRAYVHDTDSFEGVAVDLANVYAEQSLKVELYSDNQLLTSTTYAKNNYPIDAAEFTCLIVLDGTADEYWNTTIECSELTVANIPTTIKVYVYADDNWVHTHTYNNALGEGTNVDETEDYKALDCVLDAPVAKVGNTEYYNINNAIANWTAGSTLTLLEDVTLSDVITLKSTEHHILNLDTYTMTAAEGKNAIEIKSYGFENRNERAALTIMADETNPDEIGTIDAGAKSCIYYKYDATLAGDKYDRPIIYIKGGVYEGSSYSGISSTGHSTAQDKCATFNISGGTFNCGLNLTKTKLLTSGGLFNKSVSCTGGSTSIRLISGGTFESWGWMTADAASKFAVGTAISQYNVGVYVDDKGYLVVGGPVITEAGGTFEASSANYSGWSTYLQYSSAATNGLYYTSVEEALADNNKTNGSVNIYTDELDLRSLNYKGTLVIEDDLTVTFNEGITPAWSVVAKEDGKIVVYTDDIENGIVKRTYSVIVPVAKIGDDKFFASLEAAIEAVQANETITMLADVTLSETMTIEKAITLNLNENTVTGADDAIVFNVKAATTIKNGTVLGNKSGTSSGLIDIYADINLDGVTIETTKIRALAFKESVSGTPSTATLTNCNVTGGFKGYGGSVWEIKSGVYKASSTSITDQLNGTASVSGGTFYYEIDETDCAPGYVVKNNGDGTWTVEYAPAAFVDTDKDGVYDEDVDVLYGNLDQIFADYRTGDVHVVLTKEVVVANNKVDTDVDAHFYITTNVEGGTTMDFLYADPEDVQPYNCVQNMDIAENVTLNVKYFTIYGNFNLKGTVNAFYPFIIAANVNIAEDALFNQNVEGVNSEAIQIKDGAVVTVEGKVEAKYINLYKSDSYTGEQGACLRVTGANAEVNVSSVDLWKGETLLIVENGAKFKANSIKASRGGSIEVDGATIDAAIRLGHDTTDETTLTASGTCTLGQITLATLGSKVVGPEGFEVVSGVNGYGVNYYDEVYSLVQIVTQSHTLSAGWNWFSSYVDINGEAGWENLKTGLGSNAMLVKNQNSMSQYYNTDNIVGWDGTLEETSVKEMYMIRMSADHDLTLTGKLVDPSENPITLHHNGWTWIGYPMNQDLALEDVLKGFNPNAGDRIKSHQGFSQYYDNELYKGWWGTLETMTPGYGYMYYNAGENNATLKYSYPADGSKSELRTNITSENNYWVPASSQYAGNMNIVAMLEADGDNYEIAAFVDGEVRGSARPIYVEPLDAYMFFLTVHGEDVEEMTFKVYDLATGEEYNLNDRMNYTDNAIVGSITEPYIFRGTVGVGETSLSEVNVYPNPTTTGNEINLGTECDTVEVFNALGVKVAEYQNVDTVDALETAGVYVIRITNDGNVQNCRLIVK